MIISLLVLEIAATYLEPHVPYVSIGHSLFFIYTNNASNLTVIGTSEVCYLLTNPALLIYQVPSNNLPNVFLIDLTIMSSSGTRQIPKVTATTGSRRSTHVRTGSSSSTSSTLLDDSPRPPSHSSAGSTPGVVTMLI